MDKDLDSIISDTKKATIANKRRNPRRNVRTQVLGSPAATAATRPRVTGNAAAAPTKNTLPAGVPSTADKIIVSNLPADVNEGQIKELFASTVGPTKEVHLNYDASGRSKGIAAVTFSKKGDANRAYTQYHNRLIDGKRPMKIEIVFDPSRSVSLASRVAPAPVSNGTQVAKTTTAGGGGGGRGRRPRRGQKRGERPQKSAADLDAEMEDYTASNAPAAAAPAATAA
ncbi:hypothetical protein Agabi119p4_8110 [Agaricus bisporus var. burnettii]|uniref:RRM domain-containing protein n=1 Tax=Agaricus bisporus var. burnettii TaxID=192524 RepID=A0A8H7EY48_AGABI|nr:hypothetical protein Agabi119p4_8110 [Agaricus bisporus var. burnettii]